MNGTTGKFCGSQQLDKGFSMIELLAVMSLIGVIVALTVPAIQHVGAGNMQNVQAKAQGLLEASRQFAQAKRTYVRVGAAEIPEGPGMTSVILQSLYSATGDLRNDTPDGLADQSLWRAIAPPTVLTGVKLDPTLKIRLPSALMDVSTLGDGFNSFHRQRGSGNVHYEFILQFDPQGQVSIEPDKPARYCMIGLVNPRLPATPVVILLSGLSGKVRALPPEDLQP